MKAFGSFVVETNNGDGWVIAGDPDDTNSVLHTRARARDIRKAYISLLDQADKPYKVRVLPVGELKL